MPLMPLMPLLVFSPKIEATAFLSSQRTAVPLSPQLHRDSHDITVLNNELLSVTKKSTLYLIPADSLYLI